MSMKDLEESLCDSEVLKSQCGSHRLHHHTSVEVILLINIILWVSTKQCYDGYLAPRRRHIM